MSKEYAQDRFNYAIKLLENTLSKCQSVDFNKDAKIDQSPAYVIGYTESTVRNALIELQTIIDYLN